MDEQEPRGYRGQAFKRAVGQAASLSSAWDKAHLRLGDYHLWIDSSGRLRVKSSAPTGDTDGTIVGTQL